MFYRIEVNVNLIIMGLSSRLPSLTLPGSARFVDGVFAGSLVRVLTCCHMMRIPVVLVFRRWVVDRCQLSVGHWSLIAGRWTLHHFQIIFFGF